MKKLISVIILVVLSTLILVGCGSDTETNGRRNA